MSSKINSIKTFFSPASRNKQTKKQKQLVKKEAKLVGPTSEDVGELKIEVNIADAVEKSLEIKSEQSKENLQPVLLSPKIKPVSIDKVTKVTPVKAEPASPKPVDSPKEPEPETETTEQPVAADALETSKDTNKSKTKNQKLHKHASDDDDEDYVPEKPKISTKSKKDKTQKSKDKIKTKISSKESDSKTKESTSKTKTKKSKKEVVLSPNQKKLTDFNFIRRSRRVPTTEKRKIEERQLKVYLSSVKDEKLEHIVMKMTEGKGRGIFANKDLKRGDFVVEYSGDLMSLEEGKEKEEEYSEDAEIGCYIYYFSFKGKRYCIDATAESGRYGRLLNHSKQRANCKTRLVEEPEGIPRLIIEAKTDIVKDDELLYDYGDRSQKALKAHPWLKE